MCSGGSLLGPSPKSEVAFWYDPSIIRSIMEGLNDIKYKLAYDQAVGLLKNLLLDRGGKQLGFLASSVDTDNYKRIFARDAFWIGMAGLLTGNEELISGFKSSLEMLMNTQRADGAITSNVSSEGHLSYGVMSPRVDPNTLFVIGCIEYCKHSKDQILINKLLDSAGKALSFLENVWENKYWGLLYIPRAGNWADEYIQQGFVLYDEVLWFLALNQYAYVLYILKDRRSGYYFSKAKRVRELIKEEFWIKHAMDPKDSVYASLRHKISFDHMGYLIHFYYAQNKEEAGFEQSHGIFDAFGNILAMLTGITTNKQTKKILRFIDIISDNRYPLVPAHYPFFSEEVFKFKEMHQYRFKEFIGHYHNGGLWPWYTGPYVAALCKMGDNVRALRFLDGILTANMEQKSGMNFYEYHNARKATANVEVVHPCGLDGYFSKMFSDFAGTQLPTIEIVYKGNNHYIFSSETIKGLNISCGDRFDIVVIGPDAEDVLSAIVFIRDKNEKMYFDDVDMKVNNSEPNGTPFLGVSAAAYIIAYKALKEDRIIFFDR